ncbi:prepilin peptidase [Paenibacillus agricola]|uniref:Prepilin peptidase n=1 Tax=Paenibacillus agricola TaxID=2716264 RepID=A0ABX0IZZ6_9BACL|nr:A24 family peptidase [Paenibacillus agricola]NHN29570.1 prepilin peptidase [Paenibacillus agricola]
MNGWTTEYFTIAAALMMFIVGCSLGPWLHMIGIRLPLKQSLALPVGSYCQYCKTQISPFYIGGQLATGSSFAAATYWTADLRELWIAYPLIAILVILSVSDLKYRLLPNKIIFPAIALYVPLRLWIHDLPYWEYAAGFLVGGGILFAVSYISLCMGKPAMGGGDIKLMALLGLVLGLKLVVLALAFSALLGCIFGLILVGLGIINKKTFIPFGPFIAIAGFVVLLFGNQILVWYWGLFSFISI